MSIVDQAEALAESGGVGDALGRLEAAAAQGDVDAAYRLAIWHIVGTHVPRDLAAGRAWLRRAITIGHVDAALMEIALTANGSGGPADWNAALALLRKAAVADPLAAEHLALIGRMRLDGEGHPLVPARVERLAPHNSLSVVRNFLTPGECAHIAMSVIDMLAPAQIVDPASGRFIAHPVRTSSGAVIGPARETLVVHAVNKRLAAASGTALSCHEPLQVLHYAPGQQFRPHHDALPPEVARDNQRRITILLYLNDQYRGGATRFADGTEFRGRLGDALMFDNLKADGSPDPAARHAGLPVTHGAKWLATRWIRQHDYDPWQPA